MRDFSWNYFSATGSIDAYLLYKEFASYDQRMEKNEGENHSFEEEQG